MSDDCPICFCPLASEPWGVCLPCGHSFHRSCWDPVAAKHLNNGGGGRKKKHASCTVCNEATVEFLLCSDLGHADGGGGETHQRGIDRGNHKMERNHGEGDVATNLTTTKTRASSGVRSTVQHLGIRCAKGHRAFWKFCSNEAGGNPPPRVGSYLQDDDTEERQRRQREREEEGRQIKAEVPKLRESVKEQRLSAASRRSDAEIAFEKRVHSKLSSSVLPAHATSHAPWERRTFSQPNTNTWEETDRKMKALVWRQREAVEEQRRGRRPNGPVPSPPIDVDGALGEGSDGGAAREARGAAIKKGSLRRRLVDTRAQTLAAYRFSVPSDPEEEPSPPTEAASRVYTEGRKPTDRLGDRGSELVSSLADMGFEYDQVENALRDMRKSGVADIDVDKVLGVVLGGNESCGGSSNGPPTTATPPARRRSGCRRLAVSAESGLSPPPQVSLEGGTDRTGDDIVRSLMNMGFENDQVENALSEMRNSSKISDVTVDDVLAVVLSGDAPCGGSSSEPPSTARPPVRLRRGLSPPPQVPLEGGKPADRTEDDIVSSMCDMGFENDQVENALSEMRNSGVSDINVDKVLGVVLGGNVPVKTTPDSAGDNLVSSLMDMGFEVGQIHSVLNKMRHSGMADISVDKVLGVLLGSNIPRRETVDCAGDDLADRGHARSNSTSNVGNQANLLEDMRPSSCRDPALPGPRDGAGDDFADHGNARYNSNTSGSQAEMLEDMRPSSSRDPALPGPRDCAGDDFTDHGYPRSTSNTSGSQASMLEDMRSSSCRDPALAGPSAAPVPRDSLIEIVPGQSGLLLRGRQTWNAMHNGTAILVTCMVCNQVLQCCPEADYFLCPGCDVVSDCGGGRGRDSGRHTSIGSVGLAYKREVPELQ